MSDPPPVSERRRKVELEFNDALHLLRRMLSKNGYTDLEKLQLSDSSTIIEVESGAAELENVIAKIIQTTGGQNDYTRTSIVKEIVRKWYQASYPFANVLLNVAQTASSVWPLRT